MAVCYIRCESWLAETIRSFHGFAQSDIHEVEFPITALNLKIDVLIAGPTTKHLDRLAATVSDWKLPPVTLLVIRKEIYAEQAELLNHHPRTGRSIFCCDDTPEGVMIGLAEVDAFFKKRAALQIDNSISGNFITNNISPRWLFQTMMEQLDEYIYFKDGDSRFLAVSQYLATQCEKDSPVDVLGLQDFDLFDSKHARDAYQDERKIANGELKELYKEEPFLKAGKLSWLASCKLPLHTRSHYLAGSFGISRDITESKELHEALKQNHERMQGELRLARNLQDTLMQQNTPEFVDANGCRTLEIASKYIPSFHLSGDFFSIVKTPDGGVGILIADVMGHGVRAAMVTAMIQIAVQQLSAYSGQPAAFMGQLNAMMQRIMQPSGQTIFATAVYTHLDLDAKRLTYAQAGAQHGICIPANDAREALLFDRTCIRSALGLLPDTEYAEASIDLEAGDEIILYTDGIIEATIDDHEYGQQRLIEFLQAHRHDQLPDMLDSLLDSVRTFTKNKELDDDVCLIGLRVRSTT